MSRKVEIRIGHMTWTGPTKKAAEAERDEHLGRLFARFDQMPELVVYDGRVQAVVWMSNTGWGEYALVHYREDGTPYRGSGCMGSWTFDEAVVRARRHVAQNVFALSESGEVLHDGCDVIGTGDADGLNDHMRWIAWQLEYHGLRMDGMIDVEARAAMGPKQ